MSKLFMSQVFGSVALAEASGATQSQIDAWCRAGILLPRKRGKTRSFTGGLPILDATEAVHLTAAGYPARQIALRFRVQRAALAGLSPDAALVQRFKFYIATIEQLAALFGVGPDFDHWHARQAKQLARMERALAESGDRSGDAHALNLLAAMREDDTLQALAG